jgi:hypothetical protein
MSARSDIERVQPDPRVREVLKHAAGVAAVETDIFRYLWLFQKCSSIVKGLILTVPGFVDTRVQRNILRVEGCYGSEAKSHGVQSCGVFQQNRSLEDSATIFSQIDSAVVGSWSGAALREQRLLV